MAHVDAWRGHQGAPPVEQLGEEVARPPQHPAGVRDEEPEEDAADDHLAGRVLAAGHDREVVRQLPLHEDVLTLRRQVAADGTRRVTHATAANGSNVDVTQLNVTFLN